MAQDVQLESFAAWMLAAQLASGVIQSVIGIFPQAGIAEKKVSPIVEVSRRSPELDAGCEAYTITGDRHIYVLTDTDTYKAAKNGSREALVKLASIIAHEQYHIDHGDTPGMEKGAYNAQLMVLQRLKASATMIQGVERAMKTVVK